MKLRYLHTFTDRHNRRRYYARVNGVRHPLPSPGEGSVPSEEFMTAYRTAVGNKVHGSKRDITLRTGTIYVVGFADYVKIGYTTSNLKRRLSTLATGCPEDVRVLLSFPGTIRDEESLHKRFAKHRLRREWFQRVGDLAMWINEGRHRMPIAALDGNPKNATGSG